jgi:hypothetical protein
MNRIFAVKHNTVKRSVKLIAYLDSKRHRPSGMLIPLQNPYAPRSKQHTGRREAQSHEPVNKGKNLSVPRL